MMLKTEPVDVAIITDGASSGNPGPSGYAAIIQVNRPGSRVEERAVARNSFQILPDLETPARLRTLLYMPRGSGNGGTGQALRIAHHYNTPVFDFGCYEAFREDRIRLELQCFLKSVGIGS
ncbi:MAG TPA: hypothetical protein VLH08_03080 [Acidobacteriota bacterium]|nr:hypothetical protein [Acidobacteriota bacterium]